MNFCLFYDVGVKLPTDISFINLAKVNKCEKVEGKKGIAELIENLIH
jgi:hypothetical protein